MVSAVRLRFLSGKKLDDWQHSFKPKRYRLKGTVNACCMPRGWASGAILRDRYEAARPRPRTERIRATREGGDRESIGEGERVSVTVTIGGRRERKKKKKQK